jgi:hypothetical protein
MAVFMAPSCVCVMAYACMTARCILPPCGSRKQAHPCNSSTFALTIRPVRNGAKTCSSKLFASKAGTAKCHCMPPHAMAADAPTPLGSLCSDLRVTADWPVACRCRALCGFTHPLLQPEGKDAKFGSFQALKKHIEANHQQFFCDVCLKGRKVRAVWRWPPAAGRRRSRGSHSHSGPRRPHAARASQAPVLLLLQETHAMGPARG